MFMLTRVTGLVVVVAATFFLCTADTLGQTAEDSFSPIQGSVDAVTSPEDSGAVQARSLLTKGVPQTSDEVGRVNDFCRCVGSDTSAMSARIESALRAPLRSPGIDFADTALREVLASLEQEYDIPVQLDTPALDAIGLGPDEPVTAKLNNISLRSALRLMLKQLQLTYMIQNEVLLITTPEEVESHLLTCVYDVRPIIGNQGDKGMDTLIDTIVSCIATASWAENGGGEAEIRPLTGGLLVVSQSRLVHDDIRSLLALIREAKLDGPPGDEGEHANVSEQASHVVTRSYQIQLPSVQDEDTRAQIKTLITGSLPDAKWEGRLENGEAVSIMVLPDRVIVRHTPTTQDQVKELLKDSNIATPWMSIPRRGGGTGGGGFDVPHPKTGPSDDSQSSLKSEIDLLSAR